ncbi:MAG: sigma-70 family RNA polymerase sigma factor [Bacilli bacterium]|nr:sigma-70 family RNA polymerase sigma factor [Bacilli bacterium]
MQQEILMKIHRICLSFKIIKEVGLDDNENQFIKYIEVTIKNIYYDYLRKDRDILIENLDLIKEEKNVSNFEKLLFNELTEKEIDFLSLFIENGKLLTDQEVANKLGISQQAVNKKRLKIYRKVKK